MGSLDSLELYWSSSMALAILSAFLLAGLVLAVAYRRSSGRAATRLRLLRVATWLSVVFWTFIAVSLVLCFLLADPVEYSVAVAKTVAVLSISLAIVTASAVALAISRGVPARAADVPAGPWLPDGHPLAARVAELAADTGVTHVRVRLVLGWPLALVEPPHTIVVSQGLLDILSSEELDAVLLHELCHLAEADGPEKAFLGAMRRLLFFDPFLRVLERASSREREYQADAWVAKRMGGGAALASALQRLAIESPGVAARGLRHPPLRERVARIEGAA